MGSDIAKGLPVDQPNAHCPTSTAGKPANGTTSAVNTGLVMGIHPGHQLFGLALVYDWCFAGLDEQTRKTIRETLIRRGSAMFDAAATGRAWWRQSYLQNHLWVNITGLSTAGLATPSQAPDPPN